MKNQPGTSNPILDQARIERLSEIVGVGISDLEFNLVLQQCIRSSCLVGDTVYHFEIDQSDASKQFQLFYAGANLEDYYNGIQDAVYMLSILIDEINPNTYPRPNKLVLIRGLITSRYSGLLQFKSELKLILFIVNNLLTQAHYLADVEVALSNSGANHLSEVKDLISKLNN